MWDETGRGLEERRRNGSSRARHEVCFQDVRLGPVQDEHDHDDGHGAYGCFGSGNGPVDGIGHSQQILVCTDTIGPDHLLLASRKIHLWLSTASAHTSSLASLPTNNSCVLLLRLDFPLLKLQSSSTRNTEHVSPHRDGHYSGIWIQCFPYDSAKRRFLLRGNFPAHHFRPVWSLVGDEIPPGHNRCSGGSPPACSASSQSSPRRQRESDPNLTGPGWRRHNSEAWRPSACRRDNNRR